MNSDTTTVPKQEAADALNRLKQIVKAHYSSTGAQIDGERHSASHPLPRTVLPLLRHLAGNMAQVDTLWKTLIDSHPVPKRAVIVEVGVAGGQEAMVAAESGMRILAVEPNPTFIQSPILVAKSRQLPNLELIHAAAGPKSGTVNFKFGGTGGHLAVGGGAGTNAVPMKTLDSIFEARGVSHIYMIKVRQNRRALQMRFLSLMHLPLNYTD